MAPPAAIEVLATSDTQGIVIPDALTVNGVSARRAKAGKLNGGTAAFTSSDFFKHPVSGEIWTFSISLTI
jgi:aromatic amino acid aminotransferase I